MLLDRKKNQLISLLIIFILFSSIFIPVSSAKSNISNSSIKNKNYNGFIIEFVDEPLMVFINQLKEQIRNSISNLAETVKNEIFNESIANHKEKIKSVQTNAKKDILDLIGKAKDNEGFFSKTFSKIFNGVLIKDVSDSIIQKIKNLPYVKNVYPNVKISICLDKSIPVINADDVWELHNSKGDRITGKGVKIALLDTGVDYIHPDLKDSYKGGYDFVTCNCFDDSGNCISPKNEDDDPKDDEGHGTHCAGIAVGSGEASNYEYIGVAPEAELYMYKVLNKKGEGTSDWLIDGLERAVDDGADIISISAGTVNPGSPDDAMSKAVDNAVKAGVTVVVAAGNNGSVSSISSPGTSLEAITVGSSFKNGHVSPTSSKGPVIYKGVEYIKPDVVAPGESIKSANKNGKVSKIYYTYKSGTSMATPHVAGAAALLLQIHPDWSPEKIKTVLKDNAINLGKDPNTQGNGSINITASLNMDQDIILKAPYIVNEKSTIKLELLNSNNKPIKFFGLFLPWIRCPRIKYGECLKFRAPNIINPLIKKLESRLFVIKLLPLKRFNTKIIIRNN